MSRIEVAKKQYPNHYKTALSVEDPTKDKHKYLLWIAKQLSKGNNISDISATLKFFHSNTNKFIEKDIYNYENLKALEDLIKEMGFSKRQHNEDIKNKLSKRIYEDDDFILIRIDGKEAMIIYGENTKWCVAMKKGRDYEDYTEAGNIFYVLMVKTQKLPYKKYAIVKENMFQFSVFDETDQRQRYFSRQENTILKPIILAIIHDEPPTNMLTSILKEEPTEELISWLKQQDPTTIKYIIGKRPILSVFIKSDEELMASFSKNRYLLHDILDDLDDLDDLKYNNNTGKYTTMIIKKILNIVITLNKPKMILSIIEYLKEDDLKLFASHSNAMVRESVLSKLPNKEVVKFLNDPEKTVFKKALSLCSVDDLVNFYKTNPKKTITVKRELINRIGNINRVANILLSQDIETLSKLAIRNKKHV
jgi:hypothetical protein